MPEQLSPEAELAWDEFYRIVNMTSEELRAWLLTEVPGTDAFPAEPGLGLPELGRGVVEILRKRKTDLIDADIETMQRVIDFVEDRIGEEATDGPANDRWRGSLMSVGHDPLKTERASSSNLAHSVRNDASH